MRRAVLSVLACVLVVGCAGPSVDRLPEASGRSMAVPGTPGPADGLDARLPEPVGPPTDPLSFFRAIETVCSQHATLASRGTDPGVEPGRFTGARVVRELSGDRALIEDGRGTRLIVDRWTFSSAARLLPESGREDEPLPDPYRLSCPQDGFGSVGQESAPAPVD